MSERPNRLGITRRRLFGAGAGAGAAAALGVALPGRAEAAAEPQLPPDGLGGLPAGAAAARPMALPAALVGTAIATVTKFDFVATSLGSGSTLQIDEVSGGVFNSTLGGALLAPLDLPPMSRLRQVDVYGFRNGIQNWYLRKVDVTGLVSTVASNAVTASGALQVTFDRLDEQVVPGQRYYVEVTPSSPASTALGAVYQYVTAGTALVLFGDPSVAPDPLRPSGPVRVYDSRKDVQRGKIAIGENRLISVAQELGAPDGAGRNNVVPVGARAISYNLTITETETSYGFLTVIPGGQTNFGNSSINWDKPNTTIANGLIVGLNSRREVVVRCDGFPATPVRTHFVIDVTGYFV